MSLWSRKGGAGPAASQPIPPVAEEELASSSGHAATLADADVPQAKSSRLRMGLLLAASALGGGIAVVLYNRRLLAKMREPRVAEPTSSWDDGA